MKKLSAACACTAIISCLIPAIAFGQLGPGSEPAPRTYRDVDALGDQAFHSLARAVQLPCIDEDVRDGLIARVDAIIRQILEWSTAHVNDRHTATAELSKAGHWIDALTAEMSRLKLKQPCLEPLPRTSAGSNPPPPSGSGPAGPGACPPDESARAAIAKRFDEGSKEEETLQAEDSRLQTQIRDNDLLTRSNELRIKHDDDVIADPGKRIPGKDDDLEPRSDRADQETDNRRRREQNEQLKLRRQQIAEDLKRLGAELHDLGA